MAPVDPTAVLGRRYGAFFIDLFLVLILPFILYTSNAERVENGNLVLPRGCEFFEDRDYVCFETDDDLVIIEEGDFAAIWLLAVGGWALNYVILQSLTGGSVGKLMVGLRVVNRGGQRANFGQVLVRSLFLAVDLGCFLVGVITSAVTRGHRRVGDLVGGTYVVAATSVGYPPEPGSGYGPPAWGQPGYGPPGYATPGYGQPPTPGWGPPPPPPPPPPTQPGGWAPPPGPPQ